MLDIRPTTVADAPALRSIRLAALAADPTAFGRSLEEEQAYEAEHWVDRAAGSDRSQMFVAVDDSFVGLVGAYVPDDDGPVELVSMWIDPSARGAGVGRQLVEEVVRWAGQRDAREVRLWVTRGNDTAVRLYERCGFVLTEEVGVSPSDPCREELRMARTV